MAIRGPDGPGLRAMDSKYRGRRGRRKGEKETERGRLKQGKPDVEYWEGGIGEEGGSLGCG